MRAKPTRSSRLAVLLLWTALVPGGGVSAGEGESLAELVALALVQNPELGALVAEVEALDHEVTRAGAWSDPDLMVAYQNVPTDSFSLGDEPMSMLDIRLSQTIPFLGKTDRREGVARKEAEARQWDLEEQRVRLRAAVKQAYYRLALARQLEQLTRDHVALVGQLADTVRIRYEVGRAAQQELLRLEVLRVRLTDDLADFAQQQRQLGAALNGALHRDVETPVETPVELQLGAPPLPAARLRELALDSSPALKRLATTAERHRAAAELARFEAVPDPTLFAAYGVRTDLPGDDPGQDLVTFGVSVPLPLFYSSRNEAVARAASARARAAKAQASAQVDAIAAGLADGVAVWERAAQKVTRYREQLLPAARRTLEAALAAYRVDRADFLAVYEAELELLDFERTVRRSAVDGLVARAEVERLVGKELP